MGDMGGAVVEVGLTISTKGIFALVPSSNRIMNFMLSSDAEYCSSSLEEIDGSHGEGRVWMVHLRDGPTNDSIVTWVHGAKASGMGSLRS